MMASIGANTIRVYHVDPTADHSACMTAFANHGIYLFVDLSEFHLWSLKLKNQCFNQRLIKTLKKVPLQQQFGKAPLIGTKHNFHSLLLFWKTLPDMKIQPDSILEMKSLMIVGFRHLALANKQTLIKRTITDSGSQAAPFIKAAITDMKLYISKRGFSRPIYVGYSAADIASIRPMLQDYLACSKNELENIDFWALNAYEWCSDDNTFATSGYEALNDFLVNANYNIPVFFSEDGCNVNPPRHFKDLAVIFSKDMTDVCCRLVYCSTTTKEDANLRILVLVRRLVQFTITSTTSS